MFNTESLCSHGNIPQNCPSCNLVYIRPQEKSELDTLRETISELKTRVSILEEHQKKQIDENYAVSKHLDDLYGWKKVLDSDLGSDYERIMELEYSDKERNKSYRYLRERVEKLENFSDFKKLEECLFNGLQTHLTILNMETRLKELEEWTRSDEDAIYLRLNKLEKHILFMLSDHKTQVNESKTTGLTFEEAMTAFKSGKKIRFHDGMSVSTIYEPKKPWAFGFGYDEIQRDQWEIVDDF